MVKQIFHLIFVIVCIVGLQIQATAINIIEQKQSISISEVKIDRDSNYIPDRLGDKVKVSGRVTVAPGILRKDKFQLAIQDQTAAIFVFSFKNKWSKINVGDSLEITGIINQYRGLTQIIEPKIRFIDTLNRRKVKPILLNEKKMEASESMLVTTTGQIIHKKYNSGGSYIMIASADAGETPLMVFIANSHKTPNLFEKYLVGEKIKVSGMLGQHDYGRNPNAKYQILPLSSRDLVREQHTARFYIFMIGGVIFIALFTLLLNLFLRKKVKNRTQKLKESEKRFSDLTESTSSAILIHLDNQIVYANRAIEQISGFSKKEILFKPLEKLIQFDANKLFDIKNTKKTFRSEAKFSLSNKKQIWLDYTIAPIVWDNKNASIITAVDVTTQKQAEVKAEQSENRFQFLANSAPVGIFRCSINGDTTYVNPKWSELSGMPAHKAMGKGWLEAVHPDYKEMLINRWDVRNNENKASFKEYRFLHPDGNEVWVMSQATPEYNENNKIVGYIGSITNITELKNGEQLLKLSEEKYKYLFHNNPQPMWIYDLETLRFLEVNGTAELKYGYSRAEFLSMTLQDIRPKEDMDELISDVKQTSKLYNNAGVWRHLTKQGECIDVEITSHHIEFANRTARMVLVNDVTARKKTQDALQESEQSLNEAQLIAKMGDWEFDVVSNTSKWSENCFRLYGLEPNKIAPTRDYFISIIHPDDREKMFLAFEELRKTQTLLEIELRVLFPDGEIKWLSNKIIPIIENGIIVKVKGVSIDIDILKKSSLALKESEEKFRSIFENHSAVKLIIDPSTGAIEDANQAAANFYGLTREEIKSMGIYKVNRIPKDQILPELIKVTTGEQDHFEFSYLRADGSTSDVEVFSSITTINGKTYLYSILQDVTEKNKLLTELIVAKEKAEENDRLKTAFLNNISHEFRTPMNGILGFSELLKTPDLEEDERNEFLNLIEKSGQRMLNTISEIVEISKIETKQLKLDIKKTDINKIIADLYTIYKPETDSKNLEFIFEQGLSDEEAIIKTDSNKLSQIIEHLLTNAIKFTEKGTIGFGYKVVNNKIEFYVNDTGTGLTEKYKEHLFSSFTQGSTSYSRDYEGLGLGLSISLAYVELMGGQINVDSEMGKGSNFYFNIPYIREEAPVKVQSTEKIKTTRITPNVLIVEDEPTSLQFLSIILKHENLNLFYATNGAEAIDLIKKEKDIEIVLMDLKMPGIDGFEATRQIKQLRPELFVIAQTAFAFESDKQKAFGAGCDEYITKPIKKDLLLKKINSFLN